MMNLIQNGILFPLVLSISLSGCAQQSTNTQTDTKNSVAIAFYNCENFFDNVHNEGKEDYDFTPEGSFRYTDRIYHQKLHNIATVIQKMPTPAIIGMAEVENDNVLTALASQPEITDRHYRYVWYNGPDKRGINVALLYDPAQFKLLGSEPIHVSLDASGRETTRDVLHVQGMLRNDTVDILVNHWPSRRGGEETSDTKREIAAATCRAEVEKIIKQNHKAKVIIMGDLNDNPTDKSVADVLKVKFNKNEVKNKDLYNPWAAILSNGTGTLQFKHHWDLFDQIILSGNLVNDHIGWLHYLRAEVFKPDFIVDHYRGYEGQPHRSFKGKYWINGYSDHFPVVLYLSY